MELQPIEIPTYDFEIAWKEFFARGRPCPGGHDDGSRPARVATAKEPQGRVLIDDCFLVPGSPVAIALTLSEAGRPTPVRLWQPSAKRCAGRNPEQDLILGGRSVATMELNNSVVRAAWNKAAPLWKLHERSVMLLSGLVGISWRSWPCGMCDWPCWCWGSVLRSLCGDRHGPALGDPDEHGPDRAADLCDGRGPFRSDSRREIHQPRHAGESARAVERATRMAALPCINSVFTRFSDSCHC